MENAQREVKSGLHNSTLRENENSQVVATGRVCYWYIYSWFAANTFI